MYTSVLGSMTEEVCERVMQNFLCGKERRLNEEEGGLEWRFTVKVGIFGFGHKDMGMPKRQFAISLFLRLQPTSY